MDRKQQQIDLIFKLGLVLSPLYDLINNPENHTGYTRSRAGAKFFHDLPEVEKELYNFTRSEPGHKYEREYKRLVSRIAALEEGVKTSLDDPEQLSKLLDKIYSEVRETVFSIPVPDTNVILEPHTPFRTYTTLKNLFQGAINKLVFADRYLDSTVFYRYLLDLPLSTSCILVTQPQASYNKPAIWAELMDVSRLYAAERGSNSYRLVVNSNFHDRWLCVDDQFFSLGGSIKHAGQKNSFTITQVTPSPENRQKIDDLVKNGTELFGPNQTVHP